MAKKSSRKGGMMTPRPLFDVVISVSGNDAGAGVYDVTIIDRYHGKKDDWIGRKSDMSSLDEAMEFAKGSVTAFLEGTRA